MFFTGKGEITPLVKATDEDRFEIRMFNSFMDRVDSNKKVKAIVSNKYPYVTSCHAYNIRIIRAEKECPTFH